MALARGGGPGYRDLQATRAPILAKIQGCAAGFNRAKFRNCSPRAHCRRVAFLNNCAACHGAGAQGAKGYPNLNTDAWIWGGKLADIKTTIEHGVRWDADKQTRVSSMPAFGRDGILTPAQVSDVADYVRTMADLPDAIAPETKAKSSSMRIARLPWG